MKKLPESVMIIAPAALITALVLVLGFLMVGPDEGTPEAAVIPSAPVVTSPGSDLTDDPMPRTSEPTKQSKPDDPLPARPPGKLKAPPVTLKRKPAVRIFPQTSFRISSFNLLGHSHTEPGGHKARLAAGPVRMGWQLGLLDAHQVDVVGMQELQPQQWGVLNGRSSTWEVYPGGSDRLSMPNSIAWRRSVFRAVRTETVSIPYFFGEIRQMPYVQLEHLETKQRIWVANFHNPANAHGDASRWRAEALRREIDLANTLALDGYPVFFTGDMNDRTGYFCGLTGNTDLRAADGGSNEGACLPPSPMQVDWIFGSKQVTFSGYVADRSAAVARTTDHPIVVATATLPERRQKIVRKGR
ncbi:endonuclease/exonuclease/phosphatase family protein [Nocardioides daejeonensis]|uniref:endonuclease/exonuclease/phosphatase family protein n=1 Tax=Nocardioides daejeonensis TaxID=1046556 RepID=UPI000D74EEE9|nr:endonuclease/exonuclease/phosphatase family protein [Nocardioides daejeonensis]